MGRRFRELLKDEDYLFTGGVYSPRDAQIAQVFPKRCGHIAGKTIIGREEAIGKYRAAVDTRNRLDPTSC